MKIQKSMDHGADANDVTRISKGARLEGKLMSSGDVRIDGEIDGILYAGGRIVAGEDAVLSGSLYCDNLDLWGKVDGDVFVKEVLTLKNTAAVKGNIRVNRLQVEIGAQINGSCRMIDGEEFDKLAAELGGKS